MHVLLKEERRQKKLVVNLKKPKQQRWSRPGTEPQGSISVSTSGSGSRSETRPQNAITAGSRSRKSASASHGMGDDEGDLSIYGHLPRCPTTITAGSRSRKRLEIIFSAVASTLSRRSRPEHPAHRSGGGLFAAASRTKKMHVLLKEERRQKKLVVNLKKPKQQRWFRPGTELRGSVSVSTSGSGSRNETRPQNAITAGSRSRKSASASHGMGDDEGDLSIYGHLPRCPTTITAGSRSRKRLEIIFSAVASTLSRRSRPEHPAHRSGGGLKYNDLPPLS